LGAHIVHENDVSVLQCVLREPVLDFERAVFMVPHINVPQSDRVSTKHQREKSSEGKTAIWRTEEPRLFARRSLKKPVGLAYVSQIVLPRDCFRIEMRKSMISDGVAFGNNALHDRRVLLTILAQDEECRPGSMLAQNVEYARRVVWIGSIVES
jgi:hypothetical protein